jgi:hypothetical protein
VKTLAKSVTSKLAMVALGLLALAAPARAGQILPNGLRTLNGLSTSNGLRTSNGLSTSNGLRTSNGLSTSNGLRTLNGLRTSNGLCPPNGPCASADATSFVGIWKASGIDPSQPLATAIAARK